MHYLKETKNSKWFCLCGDTEIMFFQINLNLKHLRIRVNGSQPAIIHHPYKMSVLSSCCCKLSKRSRSKVAAWNVALQHPLPTTFYSQSWKYQHQQQTWHTALNNPWLCHLLKCTLPQALIPSRSIQMLRVCLCLLPNRSLLTSLWLFAGSVSTQVSQQWDAAPAHCSASSLPCDWYQGHVLIP